jgi:hypothetical protein
VDGLVTSDDEVRKLMLDREARRSSIKMKVAADKELATYFFYKPPYSVRGASGLVGKPAYEGLDIQKNKTD